MERTHRSVFALAILALLLAVLLAACGAPAGINLDSSPPHVSITSGTSASSASYHLTGTVGDNIAVTGATVTVNGGSAQAVSLTGDSFDMTVTLQAGPNVFDVTVEDAAGNQSSATITVTYTPPSPPTPGTGSLAVTIDPPTTVAASVDVTGPNSFDQNLTDTTTLTDLEAGTYNITPQTVQDGSFSYAGSVTLGGNTVTQADVVADQTTSVTVDYQVIDGALAITWSGQTLPGDYRATVTDANGNSVDLTAPSRSPYTTNVPYLAPGVATITLTDLPSGCTAKVNQSDPTIVVGEIATATVVYKCN